MSNFYGEPYICSRQGYKQNAVSKFAIDFLRVEAVPIDFRTAWNALFNFFHFDESFKAKRFQKLVNILCYKQGPKSKSDLTDTVSEILGERIAQKVLAEKLVPLFTLLVNHLAIQGKINLPPVPLFSGTKSELILSSEWMDKLPPDVKLWHVAPNQKLLTLHAEELDQRYVGAILQWYEENTDHKQISSSATLMKHYFAYRATDVFRISDFIIMLKSISALSRTVRSAGPALEVYSQVLGRDLKNEYYLQMNDQDFRISDVHQIYHHSILEARRQAGIPDPYDFSRSAKRLGMTCPTLKTASKKSKSGVWSRQIPVLIKTAYGEVEYKPNAFKPDGYSVYELVVKKSTQIGSYIISQQNLQRFSPQKLYHQYPDSVWLAHQKDWLDFKRGEKGTLKLQSQALRYFNAYLFSYLPWFKETVDPLFSIPKVIQDFDPNIFVRRTSSFLLHHDREVLLPITFPEFLEKTSNLGAKGGSGSINTLKSRQNLLIDYFRSYGDLEGISYNPLEQMVKVRGFTYAEAQKTKIDYDYWWLLKEFLLQFSWCSVLAYKDILAAGKFDKKSWKREFLKHAFNREVRFGRVTLDFFRLEYLDHFDHKTVHVFSSLLCLLSHSGLRFSNVFWLDARNFDNLAPVGTKDSEYVEIFINTDKSKLKPFDTHVTFDILNLLRTLNKIRGEDFSNEAVPYQNNVYSKWGEIVPLFRHEKTRHDETDDKKFTEAITSIIWQYETLLKKAEYPFNSYIYPKSPGISYEEYVHYKASRTQAPIRNFVLERDAYYNNNDQVPRPVSLFIYRAAITGHGLRMTFDSFYSNLIPGNMIGKLFTGQTASMVGYYSSNTVEEHALALKVLMQADIPFKLDQSDKDSKKIIKGIKENGITSDIMAIATADIDDFDLNEEYRRAPDNEIAVNRTHICAYGNVCPKKIRAILDNKKLCGLCPAALSFQTDAPAIAAEIRKIGDEIADLSVDIESGELTSGEQDDYRHKRMSLVPQLSAWICRHEYLVKMTEGEILVGEDGYSHYQKLTYHKPDESWSEAKINLWRIFETADVKTLQSERLKLKARRCARKLVANINSDLMDKIDIDPVKVAALMVEKQARLQDITINEVMHALNKPQIENPDMSILSNLLGGSDDA